MNKIKNEFNADSYFQKALKKLGEFNNTKEILYYIALDYRFCIERLLFEYLVLVKNSQVSITLQKLYRAYDLSKAIMKAEPNFFKKLEFVNIYMGCLGKKEKIIIPDLERLTKIYSGLNKFLHAPKRTDQSIADTKSLGKFIELIDLATDTLGELLSHPRGVIQLNDKGLDLFERFANSKIYKEELIKEIQEELTKFNQNSH
ncbi:MAG: hypothetical protein O6940_03975 [Ignavibacteria bacterium]|nr:hypothetical protein [Ignavibacteria bacterium]